jgi:hypothetical protein
MWYIDHMKPVIIHLTHNSKDVGNYPIFPPLETLWNPTEQINNWSEALELGEFFCWSESFINFVGESIDNKSISHNDVKIIYHLKYDTYEVSFDENGIMESPPYWGWFNYER